MAKSYTKISNDLFSGMARLKISGTAHMVLNAIIRNTVCFHRNQHELSNSFLQNATGLNERTVIRAIHDLETAGIIKIVSGRIGSHPKTIRIYTDKIVTLTNPQGGTDKNVSISTDKSDSISTDKNVSEEIKEIKQIKEEKKEFLFSKRKLTLEELAALSQAEPDEDEEYEYLQIQA